MNDIIYQWEYENYTILCFRRFGTNYSEIWADDHHIATPKTHDEIIIKSVIGAYEGGFRNGESWGREQATLEIRKALGV